MNDVLKNADIVSVHVPLMAETRHLIRAEQFKMMKRTAVFVNAAAGADRGPDGAGRSPAHPHHFTPPESTSSSRSRCRRMIP